MNEIRTTPTVPELKAVIYEHPTKAFGFALMTAKPIDEIVSVAPSVAILQDTFRLQSEQFGIHIAATGNDMIKLSYEIEASGLPVEASYLLRDGADQVPVYDLGKRGPTGRPIPTSSISVPR